LTPAATRHCGPEFGCVHPLHLPICGFSRVEGRYEWLEIVAPIAVEGEHTAVLAADVASQALQVSFLMLPGRVVKFYECHDVGQKRYDAV